MTDPITLSPEEHRSEHALTFALGRAWQLRRLAQMYSRIGARTGRRVIAEVAESMMDQAKAIAKKAGFTLDEMDDLCPPIPTPDDHAF